MNRTSPHAISRATHKKDRVNSQEGHTGGTTPALQPQEHCVHNTSVALKAAARAEPPSSPILLSIEVQDGQRGICLVKIARTCHAAAWSTHLTDVDDHVSATTLDAKLIELLHFMPCSAGRELCGQRKRTFKSCPHVSRHGISCHVVSFTGMWHVHTTSTHHHRPPEACLAEFRQRHRIHPTLTHPMPSRAASAHNVHHVVRALSWRKMVFDNRTLFTLSSRGVPHLMEVVGCWGLASDAASYLVRSSLPLVKKGPFDSKRSPRKTRNTNA